MPSNINRKAFIPLIAMVLGAVLIIVSSAWFVQVSRPKPTPTPAPTLTSSPVQFARIPSPEILRVSVGQAKAAFDLKQVVFVDVRSPESYAGGHIPGSLNIPVDELASRYTELNPDDWIITLCT
jgi:3-mercaptopyruvate sulfurtransferase SseA